jgi:hypothetical protein
MSVFTSRVTKILTLPDGSVTIRKLNPKQLEQAAKASQQRAMADLSAMGGASVLKEMQALAPAKDDAPATPSNPLMVFDRVTLLEKGITGWTLDAPVNVEAFEDLDEDTLNLLATEILTLAKPSLFQTADEAEAARKNG